MDTKHAFRQKMEAELELEQAKLAEIRARAKSAAADARIGFAQEINELERQVEATKAKVMELGEAGDAAWEQLRSGVEKSWAALRDGIQGAAARLKG